MTPAAPTPPTTHRRPTRAALAAGLATVLGLGGCALWQGPPLQAGQTQAELAAVLGPPTGRYALGDGRTRLEHATGPFGRHTWMVDLGADGRVLQWRQVLSTEHFAEFAARAPGLTVDELLRTLGRPGERQHGGLRGGQVWSWRYPTNDCLWFQVSIGADGRVVDAGYGTDPICDINDTAGLR